MKVKIYIFRKNSPWGIIKNIHTGNHYNHTINFPNDTKIANYNIGSKQLEFINSNLMERGKNLLTEINKQPDKTLTPKNFINEMVFNYKVLIDEFGKSNFDRLLNVDYAAVLKYENGKKIIDFYSLRIKEMEAQYINFEFEIDVWFSYQPYKNKTGTKNLMVQGHIDRFVKKDNTFKICNNAIYKPEQNNKEPIMLNTKELYNNYGVIGDKDFVSILNSIKVLVVYVITSTSSGDREFIGKCSLINTDGTKYGISILDTKFNYGANIANDLPYKIFLFPFFDKSPGNWTIKINNTNYNDSHKNFINRYVLGGIGGVKVSKTHILDYLPLTNNFDIKVDNTRKVINIQSKNNNQNNSMLPIDLVGRLSGWPATPCLFLNYIKENDLKFKSYVELDLPDFNTLLQQNNLHLQNKNMLLETKLYSPQFLKWVLQKFNGTSMKSYSLKNINNRDIEIDGIFSFLADRFTTIYFMKEKDKKYRNTLTDNGSLMNKSILSVENEYQLPLKTNTYAAYVENNSATLASGRIFDIFKLVGSIATLGIGGMMASGSSVSSGFITKTSKSNLTKSGFSKIKLPFERTNQQTGGIGILGGGLGIFSGINSIVAREASLSAMKNQQPEIISSDNSVLGLNTQFNQFINNLTWTKMELDIQSKLLLWNHFYLNGYVVDKLIELKDVVNSRYYFNKVQLVDVFNTLDTSERNISTLIKQKISEGYENGIMIWHYRDKNTWNGILHFDKENIEISLLNQKLDATKPYGKDIVDEWGQEPIKKSNDTLTLERIEEITIDTSKVVSEFDSSVGPTPTPTPITPTPGGPTEPELEATYDTILAAKSRMPSGVASTADDVKCMLNRRYCRISGVERQDYANWFKRTENRELKRILNIVLADPRVQTLPSLNKNTLNDIRDRLN